MIQIAFKVHLKYGKNTIQSTVLHRTLYGYINVNSNLRGTLEKKFIASDGFTTLSL